MCSPVFTVLVCLSTLPETFGTQIERRYHNYTHVPQDIDASVTELDLTKNFITYIDNSSFSLYRVVQQISLDINPVAAILPGSFYNNYVLKRFSCQYCQITQLPSDFGQATASLEQLQMQYGFRDMTALGQVHWKTFAAMRRILLWGNTIEDIDALTLPISIEILDIGLMGLQRFPNLTVARFPKLLFLRANRNDFSQAENIFLESSHSIDTVIMIASKLKSVESVEILPKLRDLQIAGNHLETIPDLLGLNTLVKLKIAYNARMSCDHRMCWRRLLDRMRAPLQSEDDVTCMAPAILAGLKLSMVNPKFMDCANGNSILFFKYYPFNSVNIITTYSINAV